jgi:hypothetical protein
MLQQISRFSCDKKLFETCVGKTQIAKIKLIGIIFLGGKTQIAKN